MMVGSGDQFGRQCSCNWGLIFKQKFNELLYKLKPIPEGIIMIDRWTFDNQLACLYNHSMFGSDIKDRSKDKIITLILSHARMLLLV